MNVKIVEGLEMDSSAEGLFHRRSTMVRLGPLNVPRELKYEIEALANDENRSISNTCIRLIERGLRELQAERQQKGL